MTPPATPNQPKEISTLQWIGIAVGVMLAVIGCISAGRWQFHRYEARTSVIDTIKHNYESSPVRIEDVLASPEARLASSHVWKRVELEGHYEPKYTALLRNRPIDSIPSVHVLVPFVTTDGHTLLVNRGWVPFDSNVDRPSAVPAPPTGEVTIVVHLRQSEPRSDKDAPVGQVQEINVDWALDTGITYGRGDSAALPEPYRNVYGSLDTELPAAQDPINALPRPSTDPKNHLSYAFQWWVFAIGAAAGFFVLLIREKRSSTPSGDQGIENPFAALKEAERNANARESSRKLRPKQQSEEDYEDSLFE